MTSLLTNPSTPSSCNNNLSSSSYQQQQQKIDGALPPSTRINAIAVQNTNGNGFVCSQCGIQTFDVRKILGMTRTTPITNSYVFKGRCLLCHPLPSSGNDSLGRGAAVDFAKLKTNGGGVGGRSSAHYGYSVSEKGTLSRSEGSSTFSGSTFTPSTDTGSWISPINKDEFDDLDSWPSAIVVKSNEREEALLEWCDPRHCFNWGDSTSELSKIQCQKWATSVSPPPPPPPLLNETTSPRHEGSTQELIQGIQMERSEDGFEVWPQSSNEGMLQGTSLFSKLFKSSLLPMSTRTKVIKEDFTPMSLFPEGTQNHVIDDGSDSLSADRHVRLDMQSADNDHGGGTGNVIHGKSSKSLNSVHQSISSSASTNTPSIFSQIRRNDDSNKKKKSDVKHLIGGMKLHLDNITIVEHAMVELYKLTSQGQEGVHKKYKSLIRSNEGISAILHAMKNYPHSVSIQTKSFMVLSNLCAGSHINASNNSTSQNAIQKERSIPLILFAMKQHENVPSVQSTACLLLGSISSNNSSNQNYVRLAGAIPLIVTALNRFMELSENDVGREGIATGECSANTRNVNCKFTLSQQHEIDICSQFVDGSGINETVNVIKYGCDALSSLMISNPTNVMAVQLAGGLSALCSIQSQYSNVPLTSPAEPYSSPSKEVNSMSAHPTFVLAKVNMTLSYFEASASKSLQTDDSSITEVVNVMRTYLPSHIIMLQCLRLLGIKLGRNVADSKQNPRQICKNKLELRKANGIRGILAVMKHHRANTEIQAAGMWALGNAASIWGGNDKVNLRPDIAAKNGVVRLVIAMSMHQQDGRIQTLACEIFKKLVLSGGKKMQCRILDDGAIPHIGKAVEIHRQNPIVQRATLSAIVSLARDNDRVICAARENGCIDAVLSSMEFHEDTNPIVLQCAYTVLTMHEEEARILIERDDVHGTTLIMKSEISTIGMNEKLIEDACRTICAMASSSRYPEAKRGIMAAVASQAEEGEAIGAVVHVLNRHFGSVNVLRHALSALIALSCKSATNQVAIHDAGGIEAVVSTMRHHSNDAKIQADACCALANICQNSAENLCKVRDSHGISLIVSAMYSHSTNEDVQVFAAGALANLCWRSSENMATIREEGGVNALLAALEHHGTSERVQGSAKGTLSNLERDAVCLIQGDRGNVATVTTTMRSHLYSAAVQEHACNVLWTLSSKSDKYDDIIRDAGGVSAIVAAMREHIHSSTLTEEALGALWNLTSSNSKNQDAVRQAGGIKAVCSAMEHHLSDPNVQGSSCCALANVASNNIANQKAILAIGGVKLIVMAMANHRDSIDAQHFGCGAIANLSWSNPECTNALIEAEAVTAVLSAMVSHDDNVDVQRSGCGALSNMCTSKVCLANIRHQEGQNALKLAASNFPHECEAYVKEVLARLGE